MMRANLPKPGTYVVAVSGGVDSVVLLNLLVRSGKYNLIVAHFDHGIRRDSSKDLMLVKSIAANYGLDFVSGAGRLGAQASEAVAREARYAFLMRTLQAKDASAIITAHHRDDRLETMIINLIRGSGRRGIAALAETALIKRPLLSISKADIKDYANQHKLSWREDSTNGDDRYLRNYIRHNILSRMSEADKQRLIELIDRQADINRELDKLISKLVKTDTKLERKLIQGVGFNESKELIAYWLRGNNLINFDRKTIERLTLAVKTKRPGTKLDVYNNASILIDKRFLALTTLER